MQLRCVDESSYLAVQDFFQKVRFTCVNLFCHLCMGVFPPPFLYMVFYMYSFNKSPLTNYHQFVILVRKLSHYSSTFLALSLLIKPICVRAVCVTANPVIRPTGHRSGRARIRDSIQRYIPDEFHMCIHMPQSIWTRHRVRPPSDGLSPSGRCTDWVNFNKRCSNSRSLDQDTLCL